MQMLRRMTHVSSYLSILFHFKFLCCTILLLYLLFEHYFSQSLFELWSCQFNVIQFNCLFFGCLIVLHYLKHVQYQLVQQFSECYSQFVYQKVGMLRSKQLIWGVVLFHKKLNFIHKRLSQPYWITVLIHQVIVTRNI